MLRLEPPDARYRTTYLEALREFRAEGHLRALHAEYFHASTDFEAFVTSLLEKANPEKVPVDRVLESVLWLISNRFSTARFHRFVCQRFDTVSNVPEHGFETSKIPLVSKRS